MNSLVSICIPTYNGEAYLAEALDSTLKQTYADIEIVISDDASTDRTLEIVESYQNQTTIPIKVFHHEPKGIGANWNHCIKHAKGTYIKFLFQDDVLEPTCVEKMVKVLKKHRNAGLVASKRNFIMSFEVNSGELQEWVKKYGDLQANTSYFKRNDENILVLNRRLFKSPLFLKSPLNKIGEPSTFMFKKSIIYKVGNFREDLKQVLDYEFCYRVLKRKEILILKEPLCKFRLHAEQATQKNKGKDGNDYRIYYELIKKDYFWYLGSEKQFSILRKRFRWIDKVFKLKSKLSAW